MHDESKRALFDFYQTRMLRAGLQPTGTDTLICPLCWREISLDRVSPDHYIPQAIGGRRSDIVPTCDDCNHSHGSKLDSQVAAFQDTVSALKGNGTLSVTMQVNGREMVADLELGDATRTFRVIGKASNPAAISAIKADFESRRVENVHLTVSAGYVSNRFNVGLLRAAYLTLFCHCGYGYVKHEIVQIVRRRIADPALTHPNLKTLVLELSDFQAPVDNPYFIVCGNVNDVPFYLVIIRARRAITSHYGVFMPCPSEFDDDFFPIMELCAAEHNGKSLNFSLPSVLG